MVWSVQTRQPGPPFLGHVGPVYAAVFSPDGKTVAFIADTSGEDQVYLVAQDGSSPATALTSTNVGQLGNLRWAPDGKRITDDVVTTTQDSGAVRQAKAQELLASKKATTFAQAWDLAGQITA